MRTLCYEDVSPLVLFTGAVALWDVRWLDHVVCRRKINIALEILNADGRYKYSHFCYTGSFNCYNWHSTFWLENVYWLEKLGEWTRKRQMRGINYNGSWAYGGDMSCLVLSVAGLIFFISWNQEFIERRNCLGVEVVAADRLPAGGGGGFFFTLGGARVFSWGPPSFFFSPPPPILPLQEQLLF